jgi:hypothetical protein
MVLGDFIADINADLTGLTAINRDISRLVGITIIDAIRFGTVCGAKGTVL